MTRLVDLADVLRTKNAGPFQITVDLFFPDIASYERVLASQVLSPLLFAQLYSIPAATVRMYEIPSVLAVKVTYDRPGPSSGAPGDRDVYGAQQHGPLLNVEIP